MPTYNVKNLKTGEKKEFRMTMKEYCQWKKTIPIGTRTGRLALQVLPTVNLNSLMDSRK